MSIASRLPWRLFVSLLCVTACLPPPSARGQAIVEGVVALPAAPTTAVPRSRYPVSATYRVGDADPPVAVVSLENASADAPLPGATIAEMAQHEYQFAPGVLPIRVGTRVRFPNLDDEYHSVFSYSKAKRFDLGRYHRDETPAEVLFDEPGVVRLFCEIHDHMRATILVLETPYFTRTDKHGRYRLEGIPAGRWTARVRVEGFPERTRVLDLRPGDRLDVSFPFPAGSEQASR